MGIPMEILLVRPPGLGPWAKIVHILLFVTAAGPRGLHLTADLQHWQDWLVLQDWL